MKKELEEVKKAMSSEGGAYLPDFADIALASGFKPASLADNEKVSISPRLMKFLMLGWLINQHFDEEAYLKANRDVAEAIQNGKIESGWTHYLTTGYFEGRSPGTRYVDLKFYRRAYPDVALAERKGQTTAAEHYAVAGRAEGRSPSAAHAVMAKMWNEHMDV